MSRRAFLQAIGAAVLCAGMAGPAFAQPPGVKPPPGGPLSKLLPGRGPALPPVTRFTAEGVGEFIFDQSSGQPLILFRNSSEIVALTRSDAARNDRIYKNDVGEPVLRISGLGLGVTVYTAARPQGAPAEIVRGPAPPIRLQTIRDETEYIQRGRIVQERLRRVMQRNFTVEVADIDQPEAWPLVVDAMELTAQFFEKNRDRIRSDSRYQHITRLLIIEGDEPEVRAFYDTLQVTVAATKGPWGRPSSAKIALALGPGR
jgi:hypothetical protein